MNNRSVLLFINMSVSTRHSKTLSVFGLHSNVARRSFARSGELPAIDETAMPLPACHGGSCSCTAGGTGVDNDWPSLTSSFAMGKVGAKAKHAQVVLGSDDLGSSGRYFGTVMGEYWCGSGKQQYCHLLS